MKDLRQVEKSTGRTPDELINQPEVLPEHGIAHEAWNFLRAGLFANERIPLGEVESYARIYGHDPRRLATAVHYFEEAFFTAIRNQAKDKDG